MRIILFLLAFAIYANASAQTQFDYMGGIPVSSTNTGCFYMDLNTFGTNDGMNDVKFVHGNGEIYFDAVSGDSLRVPPASLRGKLGRLLWDDCDVSTNNFTEKKVYVISLVKKLSNGSHVLPFKYNNFYNYIVIRVENDSIFIRGWEFNISPELYECYVLSQTK